MPKYKKINEDLIGDFLNAIFRKIGSGISSRAIDKLSKKDPKFAKIQQDLEKARDSLDKHIKKKAVKAKLSKDDLKTIRRGELPDWL
jgi:uncharacterized protein YpuA (DUF1002 family)